MVRATPTPTGGIGQPIRAPRRMPLPGCGNNHSNPERAGDCACADLAAEAAEAAELAFVRRYGRVA